MRTNNNNDLVIFSELIGDESSTDFIRRIIYEKIDKFFLELVAIFCYRYWKYLLIPSCPNHPYFKVHGFVRDLPLNLKIEFFRELVRRKEVAIYLSKND